MKTIDPRSRLEQLVKEWRTTAEADFSRAHTSDPVHKVSLLAQAAGIGHCIDSLSALLASLPEGEERGWRDIASAPKDGRFVMVGWAGNPSLEFATYVTFSEDDRRDCETELRDGWMSAFHGEYLDPQPEFWMPKPSPPPKAMRDPQ